MSKTLSGVYTFELLHTYFFMDIYSSGQNIVPDFTAEINGSLTGKALTNSLVEWLIYGDFSKQLYYTFAYASAAIGIGIPSMHAQLLPCPISPKANPINKWSS